MANKIMECKCCIRIIIGFLQFISYVFIFIFLPTKSNYENNSIENNLTKSKKINQTILGFSIILLLYVLLFTIFQFAYKGEILIKCLMIFKLIFVFISWALSLAIISDINKLLNSEVSNYIFGILHLIKKGITKVILLLTGDVILIIIDFLFVFGIFELCCKTYSYSYSPSYTPTQPRNNNDNIQGEIVVVRTQIYVQRTTINNN